MICKFHVTLRYTDNVYNVTQRTATQTEAHIQILYRWTLNHIPRDKHTDRQTNGQRCIEQISLFTSNLSSFQNEVNVTWMARFMYSDVNHNDSNVYTIGKRKECVYENCDVSISRQKRNMDRPDYTQPRADSPSRPSHTLTERYQQ